MPTNRHVIDTNVMLVASAAHETSPFAPDATPVEEAALRQKVLDWLIAFEGSDRQMVIDWGWVIVDEYKGINRRDKLTDQDYALQVFFTKTFEKRNILFSLKFDRTR
jgi:hypothetical protein